MTTEPRSAVPRFVRSVYPPLVIMAGAAIMFVWSLRYNETAREVPLLVSGSLFVLGAFDLACRFDKPALGPLRDFWGAGFHNAELNHNPRVTDEVIQITWIIGYVAGMMLFGILSSVPIFVLAYMRFSGNRRWLESLITTAIVFVFVYIVFELLLDYRLYRGALFDPRGFQGW